MDISSKPEKRIATLIPVRPDGFWSSIFGGFSKKVIGQSKAIPAIEVSI